MKKKFALLSIFALIFVLAFGLSACGGTDDADDVEESTEIEESADAEETPAEEAPVTVDGAEYGYSGTDPVECAVYEYLADEIAEQYGGGDDDDTISVPVVTVIRTDDAGNGSYNVYGDFWVFNYKVEGDTLKTISGGAHPGMMTVAKDDDDNEYEVTSMTAVKDGGEYESSAKEIFGDSYEEFVKVSSDDEAREKLRGETLASYVNMNGLKVTKYQDEGWDPVDLPL